MIAARAVRASLTRAAALACALGLAAGASAVAAGAPEGDDLGEARFTDHCLEKPVAAEALYQRALEGGALGPKERAEARFAMARARSIDGRREAAAAILETLVRQTGDASLGSWPARARAALDKIGAGQDPFAREVRGEGVHSIEATAKTLTAVLRDLGAKTSLSFALDASCAERWTVSAFLFDQSLDDLMDKLVGKGRWRRCGDGAIAIGDVASDGRAWERPVSWAKIDDPAERALGGRICATRVTLAFNGTPLSQALASVSRLGVTTVSLAEGTPDRPVRVFAKDLRLDRALDLIAVPAGCEWALEEGGVIVRPRAKKED